MINPRLKDFGPGETVMPHSQGWLVSHWVTLQIDIDGRTYEKKIEVSDSEQIALRLGFVLKPGE